MYNKQQQNDFNNINIFQNKIKQKRIKTLKEPSTHYLKTITQKLYPTTTYARIKKLNKFHTQQNSPIKPQIDNQNMILQKLKLPQINNINDFFCRNNKGIQDKDKMKEIIHPINGKIIKKNFILNYNIKSYNEDNQFMEEFNQLTTHKKKHLTQGVQDGRERKIQKPKIVRNHITKMFFQNVIAEPKRKIFSEERPRKNKEIVQDKMEYTFNGGKKFLNKTILQGQLEDKAQLTKIIQYKLKKIQ